RAVGDGLDLVRDAAVADRGVPPLRDPGGAGGEAPVRAAHSRGEGADLRPKRRPDLRRRRRRQAPGHPERLPEPDEDGLRRRGNRPQPPLVRLDRQLSARGGIGSSGWEGGPDRSAGVIRILMLDLGGTLIRETDLAPFPGVEKALAALALFVDD